MRFSERYGKTFPNLGKYVSRALTLFFGEGKNFVTIKAAERLMDRALWVAEVLRRKVEGLHQIVHVTEKKIVDTYEPKEEGLLTVREERYLTILEVTLTK
jgi:ribonuclease P/MRP protein subunit RPP25